MQTWGSMDGESATTGVEAKRLITAFLFANRSGGRSSMVRVSSLQAFAGRSEPFPLTNDDVANKDVESKEGENQQK